MEKSHDTKNVTIHAFGHDFTDLDPKHASELITLEKEGAIYTEFYDEKIDNFFSYKINFLPNEIFEYVEAFLAQQEFHDGFKKYPGNFYKALSNVSNKKIVERVKNYPPFEHNGKMIDIKGCFASFLRPEMEQLVCGGIHSRYELLPRIDSKDKVAIILDMFDSISTNINFLSNRKHNRPSFIIENEYDVQDLLYVMIKSVFSDARLEEFTTKHADRSKRIDIVIPSIDVVIETKYVRDKSHANSISDEIKIDIESYHVHPNCKTLCVFVYDPHKEIIDIQNIMKDLSGLRVINHNSFDVKTLIRN